MPAAVGYDRFYRYDELTDLLRSWADEAPELLQLESIGKSWEGRDIWLVTVTSLATGPALEKPAFLVEANIHAIEVTGCTAALHLIHKLLTEYGKDERVTRCLDTRASTSCRGSTPTAPSSRWPTGRGSSGRACGPSRGSTPRTACTKRTSTATDGS